MMSGALCTRIEARGDSSLIDEFLHEIGKKVNSNTLALFPNRVVIETYDFKNLEYVDVLSETFRDLEFYEIVYDLHPDADHWCLQTSMSKNGNTYHYHKWESPNNPKLYRKSDKEKLEIAFQYMVDNLCDEPFPK